MHKVTLFKGKKMLSLSKSEDDKYPFTFGLAKAKLIIDNLEAIQKFVVFAASDNEENKSDNEEITMDMDSDK